MKSLFVVLFSAIALLALTFCSPVCAATIIVGDYTQANDLPLLHEEEEILAPFLLGLTHAGYSFISQGNNVTLRTSTGREIDLVMGETKATIDGEEIELGAAPRYLEQRCFLPVHSLAGPLGLAVFWDEKGKILRLLPRLTTMNIEDTEEAVNIHLGAEVRLMHREGRLAAPPRVFVDIENIFAEGPQHIEVDSGALLGIRAATQEIKKPGLRVVMDLSRLTDCYAKISEDGCRLSIRIPKKPGPQPPPKAFLEEISFKANSDELVTLTLSLSAPTVLDSQMREGENTILVRMFEAASRIEELPEIPENEVVAGLKLRAAGFSGEVQELQIDLKKEVRHLLAAEGNKVRLMMGEFSLSGLKIMLDPGHGGPASGAPGRTGLLEKDVNLDIGLRLAEILRRAGAEVYMTREGDYLVRPVEDEEGKIDREAYKAELYMRPEMANSVGADIFVSIHSNANADGNPRRRTGTEVYYARPESRLLAQTLQNALVKELGRNDRGIFCRELLIVIRETKMPAVIVEVAYLDDVEEEKLLATEEFRARAARAIFDGLRHYVEAGGRLGS